MDFKIQPSQPFAIDDIDFAKAVPKKQQRENSPYKNPNYHPQPLFVSGEEYQNRNLSQEQVARLLLENPEKEYIDGETVRCKRCGKIRGRIYWNTSNGGQTYCGLPGHIGLLSQDPKKRALECQCELSKRERTYQKMTEDDRLRRIVRYTKESHIPKRYQYTTFARSESGTKEFEAGKSRCQSYCKASGKVLKRGSGIWMTGAGQSGKTHLAACIANELLDQCKQVVYVTPSQFEQELKDCIDRHFATSDCTNQYRRAQFLIVDDFDKDSLPTEQQGNWTAKQLLSVLESRFENKLPTVICSRNLPAELIQEVTEGKRELEHIGRYADGHTGALIQLGTKPFQPKEKKKSKPLTDEESRKIGLIV